MSIFQWRRTFETTAYDFSASHEDENVGRIYRHWDKKRWQWFYQRHPASSGIADNKQEAICCLEREFLKHEEARPNLSVDGDCGPNRPKRWQDD